MGMDDFDWATNLNQWGGGGWAAPTQTPVAQAANMAVNNFAQPQAPAFTAPVAQPTSMAATNAATGWGGFDSGGSSPVADDSYAWYASAAPVIVDTRPMQVPNEQANPSLGSASATGGQASNQASRSTNQSANKINQSSSSPRQRTANWRRASPAQGLTG